MAYDPAVETRIDATAPRAWKTQKKKMFGGVGYLKNGNMAFGVWKDSLIVRCAPSGTDALLSKPHTRVFDITGKAMKGWLLVKPEGFKSDKQLKDWLETSHEFASSLPKK